jgi:hypothetical protein
MYMYFFLPKVIIYSIHVHINGSVYIPWILSDWKLDKAQIFVRIYLLLLLYITSLPLPLLPVGTAAEILAQCGGKVDMIVCGAGTGGTVAGIGRKIKEQLPTCKVRSGWTQGEREREREGGR